MTSRQLAATATATLAQRIHQVLPQTQCRRCGQPDCAAYAQAVAQGDAPINQCPPGGVEGIIRIAQAISQPALAQGLEIDPACGHEGPMAVAVIDENWCIGCTLCIKACPTDAIVGGHKHMHTVLPAYCTGCELCVLACPVDCIAMEPLDTSANAPTGWAAWSQQQADQALQRYTQRQLRLQNSQDVRAAHQQEQKADGQGLARDVAVQCISQQGDAPTAEAVDARPAAMPVATPTDMAAQDRKRAMIEAAMARARRSRQTQE